MRTLMVNAAVAAFVVLPMMAHADDTACTTQRAAASLATQDLAQYTEHDDATRKDALDRVRLVRKKLQDAIKACEPTGTAGDLLFASLDMGRLETALATATSERLHDITGWEKPLKLGTEHPAPADEAPPAADPAGAKDAAPAQP